MDNRKLPTQRNLDLGAIKISGIYLVIGLLWILFSDKFIASIALDESTLTTISIYKGAGFIVVTTFLLYWLIDGHIGALKESEEKLRLITDALPALISYVDSDKRYQFNNQAYEEWFGHKVDGKKMENVLGGAAYNTISKYVDSALRGESVNYQTEIRYQDGGTRFVDATYVPDKTKDGTVRGFYALVQDITQRRQEEEEVRLWADAFEHCAQGIAIGDPDTNRIVACNSAFALLHKTRIEDVVGSSILSLYAPLDHEHVRQNVIRADQLGHAQFEAHMIRRDGSLFPVQMDLVSVRGDDGDLLYRVATVQDISGRKSAEKEIADQASIIQHINDAVITSDENLYITGWNSAAERMYGWKAEEVIGKKGESILKTEFSTTTRAEAVQEIKNTGEFFSEITQERKDGTKLQVDSRTVPMRTDDGKISGYVSVNRDITERKQAEKELANQANIFTYLNDAVITTDENFIIKSWNSAAERIYGWKAEEVVGRKAAEVLQSEFLNTTRAEVTQRLLEKGEFSAETLQMCKDGGKVHMDVRTVALRSEDGKLNTIISVNRDITERKRAEEVLRQSEELFVRVFQSSPTPIALTRLSDGKLTDVNEAFCDLFGYSREEIIGKTSLELGISDPESRQRALERLKGTGMIRNLEQKARTRNGKQLNILNSVETIHIHGDSFALTTIIDITERNKVEEEIRHLNEKLEERVIERTAQLHAANKELEAFSYSVSHDLRAPLRAINGYTSILVEDYTSTLDDEGKRICNIISAEARRMGDLIDDLLSFSRLSRKEIQSAKIDMKALAYSVFGELTKETDRERIDFKIGKLPAAHADPVLIHQVWMNLLANAIKFTSRKERAVIEVGTKKSDGEVIYCVRDNGAGFDIQYVDKLFGVFQRLHSEDDFEGTGVGLAIVQRIIQRHGGRVWAEGEVGKGATFYFALPKQGENHE